MSSGLNVFLVGFLLHGALCELSISLPKQIQALQGSCVTIPCSFQINPTDKNKLNNCKAAWKNGNKNGNKNPKTLTNQVIGDVTQKNCTTTLDDITSEHSGYYYFTLECAKLKYGFVQNKLYLWINAKPPAPKLTPLTLEIKEGTLVRVQCSAAVLCLSQPPALTWSRQLGSSEETLMETRDKTYLKVSTVTFTASYLHHMKSIACTAAYRGRAVSISPELKANVSFAPLILKSLNCTANTTQIVCACETEGNPFPNLLWHFNGASASYSISSERLSDTGLRSVITLRQPQPKDPFTFVCHSSNSLGSDSETFDLPAFEHETSPQQRGVGVIIPVFIVTVAALLVLVCVLLFVIRALNVRRKVESTVTVEQLPESNETQTQRCTVNVARPKPTRADAEGSSCGRESVVYCNVNKRILEQQKRNPSAVSDVLNMGQLYNEISHVNRTQECQYAQVKFKPRTEL